MLWDYMLKYSKYKEGGEKMPSWLIVVVLASILIGIGMIIDYIYKKYDISIDSKRLYEETKDNFGNSSSFM